MIDHFVGMVAKIDNYLCAGDILAARSKAAEFREKARIFCDNLNRNGDFA